MLISKKSVYKRRTMLLSDSELKVLESIVKRMSNQDELYLSLHTGRVHVNHIFHIGSHIQANEEWMTIDNIPDI